MFYLLLKISDANFLKCQCVLGPNPVITGRTILGEHIIYPKKLSCALSISRHGKLDEGSPSPQPLSPRERDFTTFSLGEKGWG
jgi:hypothetical protein